MGVAVRELKFRDHAGYTEQCIWFPEYYSNLD